MHPGAASADPDTSLTPENPHCAEDSAATRAKITANGCRPYVSGPREPALGGCRRIPGPLTEEPAEPTRGLTGAGDRSGPSASCGGRYAGPVASPSVTPAARPTAAVTVRPITAAEHLAFLDRQWREHGRSASFLQTPAWGAVKAEWRAESLGFFRSGAPHGDQHATSTTTSTRTSGWSGSGWCSTARCRRSSATSPTSPRARRSTGTPTTWVPGWTRWRATSSAQSAFGVRMGPPVVTRRWSAPQVKEGIADTDVHRLDRRCPRPSARSRAPAWSPSCRSSAGGRRRSRAASPPGSRSTTSGCRWSRRARVASGARVGGRRARRHEPALAAQHQEGRQVRRRSRRSAAVTTWRPSTTLYVHTAERDHFTPRPLAYFETMYDALVGRGPATGSRSTSPTTRATWSPRRSRSGSARTRGTPTAPPPPRSATSAAPTPCSGR